MEFTRVELRSLHSRSTLAGVALFTLDLGAFIACTLWSLDGGIGPRLGFAMAAGLFIALLFVVGHDACHQALTPVRWINRGIGTLAFLPSLHPYSLWDLAHNRIHHRFTNRRGLDYVWEPLSLIEFSALSRPGRLRYRFYRTAIGHCFYYLCEIWWQKLFWPKSALIGRYRVAYLIDLLLVTVWFIAWPIALIVIDCRIHDSLRGASDALLCIVISGAVPFVVFNVLMSSVVFLHHTHPYVDWYGADESVDQETLQRRSAVHVIFPRPINWVFHRIMEHTAHHMRPGIPLYRLLDAQTLLEVKSDDVLVQKWSLASHLETLSHCKLYDTNRRCWTDYHGVPQPTAIDGKRLVRTAPRKVEVVARVAEPIAGTPIEEDSAIRMEHCGIAGRRAAKLKSDEPSENCC